MDNPPALPEGYNYVGIPVDIGPDGTTLNAPITVEFPYSDADLSNAGIADDSALKIFYFNKLSSTWEELPIITIDTVNNKIIAQITHFSTYQITGLNGTPPSDLGTPQPGDLLFKLGSIFGEKPAKGWRPGHVGIYVGEKVDSNGNPYNVVEATGEKGVVRSYYNPISAFAHSDVYMGAREPKDTVLTPEQRQTIVNFVEDQVGKPYAWRQTIGSFFGMLPGPDVKGPNYFNCVGLAEAAYEKAGVNGGEGLISTANEADVLTPAEMYNATKPAGGVNPIPKIEWGSLTPNSGTPDTWVVAEICVSHPYGLSYIASVTYKTDDGYVNPNININDDGVDGDITAGDGIYTGAAYAGGDPSNGNMGLNFTVTDKNGQTDTIRLVFTYTSSMSSGQVSEKSQGEGKSPSFYPFVGSKNK